MVPDGAGRSPEPYGTTRLSSGDRLRLLGRFGLQQTCFALVLEPIALALDRYQALLGFVEGMPAGYRDAGKVVATRPFEAACGRLLEGFATCNESFPGLSLDGFDYLSLMPYRPRIDWRLCPVHVVLDGQRLNVPNDWLRFINQIPAIEESEKFIKKVRKLESPVQDGWQACRMKLSESVRRGSLDFKPWRKGGESAYSVRVTKSYRAHLRFAPESQRWIAEEIGNHRETGHD